MPEVLLAKPQESPCNGLGVQREDNDELTQGLAAGESNTVGAEEGAETRTIMCHHLLLYYFTLS